MSWQAPNRRQRAVIEQVAAGVNPTDAYCLVYGFDGATGLVRREIAKRAKVMLSRQPARDLLAMLRSGTGASIASSQRREAIATFAREALAALQDLTPADVGQLPDGEVRKLQVLAHVVERIASAELESRGLGAAAERNVANGGSREDHPAVESDSQGRVQ